VIVTGATGGELPAGRRVVTIAAEVPEAIYFIVEPNREQLVDLARLADAGELRPEVDSTFPLTAAERGAARGAARTRSSASTACFAAPKPASGSSRRSAGSWDVRLAAPHDACLP
jgi:hypothetical protein